MKQHFSNPKFDFFQYDGKVNVKESTYQARNDFYFFESLARKYTPQEIRERLLASFLYSSNPAKVWVGDVKRTGKEKWNQWQKVYQALHYNVSNDLNTVLNFMESRELSFNDLFDCGRGHPPLLRLFLKEQISLETFIILDMVLGFVLRWDKQLDDPIWNPLSLKVKKAKPFMSIPVSDYRKLMKDKFYE
jgi:hypothetical protein